MNIIKNNIEQQIKKQIEEREIAPSRDLWSEIESQSVVKKPKASFNWFLVAACLILTFSLGVLIFFNRENKPSAPSENMVRITTPAVQNPAENSTREQKTEWIVKHQEQKIAKQNSTPNKRNDLQEQESQTFTPQEELSAIKQNSAQIITDISPIQQGKAIVQADSAKGQMKRKKYVDPSTLLFSVEHKDVIEKTKGKSNVATIDLNGN